MDDDIFLCSSTSNGYFCTKPVGHDGMHRATAHADAEWNIVWPNDDVPVPEMVAGLLSMERELR